MKKSYTCTSHGNSQGELTTQQVHADTEPNGHNNLFSQTKNTSMSHTTQNRTMKNKALLILALIFSVTVKAQSVDEIVAHHIDAMGGAKKLSSLKSVIMQGTIEVGPGMKAPFSIKIKDQKKR